MHTILSLGDGLAIDFSLEFFTPRDTPSRVKEDTLILIYGVSGKAATKEMSPQEIPAGSFILCQHRLPDLQNSDHFKPLLLYFDPTEAFGKDMCCMEKEDALHHLFTKKPFVLLRLTEIWISDAEKLLAIPRNSFLDRMEIKQQALKLFHHILCSALQEEGGCHSPYIHHRKTVEKARAIIEEEYASPPRVGELARRLELSPYHLQQGFKGLTGLTVYEYIKRCRFKKATELLLHTNLSVTDIALEVGYENPSKFSSMFKKYAHITPLRYRKQR